MAEAIGTTASIVGLIGSAITLVQHIEKSRASVQGSTKSLDDVSAQLGAISASLRMVEAEPQIQTAKVQAQVEQIITVEEELQAFFRCLQARQAKGTVQKYIHALKSGDEDDKNLAQILTRLGNARSELHLRISVVNVGLAGNLQDGFQVAWRTLEGTNELLKRNLGVTLVLAERLCNRELTALGLTRVPYLGGGIVVLEASDVTALGLASSATETADKSAVSQQAQPDQSEHLKWHNNETGTKTRMNVGNMGMDAEVTIPKASVSDSTFGDGLRVMIGNVGPGSATSFNDNFGRTDPYKAEETHWLIAPSMDDCV